MNRQSSDCPQQIHSILVWVLAHTQVVESLFLAWESFYQQLLQDDPEFESKKLEIEKKIGSTVQEAWQDRLDDRKKELALKNNQPLSINGDCTSYNIHQETNRDLELRDVTLWRLSLKNFKCQDKTFDGAVQFQALEYNTKNKDKDKKKNLKAKKKIKKEK